MPTKLSNQEVCDKSIALITNFKDQSLFSGVKAINDGMTHMLWVIRWNQIEFALLRDLEDIARADKDWEDGTGQIAGLLLRLDDFRVEINKQQQAELEKLDARE